MQDNPSASVRRARITVETPAARVEARYSATPALLCAIDARGQPPPPPGAPPPSAAASESAPCVSAMVDSSLLVVERRDPWDEIPARHVIPHLRERERILVLATLPDRARGRVVCVAPPPRRGPPSPPTRGGLVASRVRSHDVLRQVAARPTTTHTPTPDPTASTRVCRGGHRTEIQVPRMRPMRQHALAHATAQIVVRRIESSVDHPRASLDLRERADAPRET